MAGPRVDGHATTTAVWICEYPYPTMLLAPPTDCEDCPLWKLRQVSETTVEMTA